MFYAWISGSQSTIALVYFIGFSGHSRWWGVLFLAMAIAWGWVALRQSND